MTKDGKMKMHDTERLKSFPGLRCTFSRSNLVLRDPLQSIYSVDRGNVRHGIFTTQLLNQSGEKKKRVLISADGQRMVDTSNQLTEQF